MANKRGHDRGVQLLPIPTQTSKVPSMRRDAEELTQEALRLDIPETGRVCYAPFPPTASFRQAISLENTA